MSIAKLFIHPLCAKDRQLRKLLLFSAQKNKKGGQPIKVISQASTHWTAETHSMLGDTSLSQGRS